MLGKGLESLIPQKGGQNNGGGNDGGQQSAAQPVFDPHSVVAPSTAQNPADKQKDLPGDFPPPLELPMLPEELELPAGEADSEKRIADSLKPTNSAPGWSVAPASASQNAAPVAKPADRFVQSSIPVAARNVAPTRSTPGPQKGDPAIAGSVFHIETDKIVPNPNQPRRHFDEASLKDLSYSIREFGILQPLVVTRIKKETSGGIDVEYQLIAGERRLMASKLLGLKTVPAIIRNVELEREKLELADIENLQREDLNPIEMARAFERLRDEFKLTQREIAAKLGKSREVIANATRLLDLPTYAQEAVEKGQISESNARFLLSVDDSAAQRKLFDDILRQGLTTRDVRDRVHVAGKRGRGRPRKDFSGENLTPELRAIQEELSSELGAPVEIQKSANNGKITITFYSEEELENILKKIKEGEGR